MKVLKYEHKDFEFEGDRLTEEQKAHFFKYGVIQFKAFISRETVDLFLEELRKIEAKWLAEGVTKINGIPLKFGKDVDGSRMIQRMCFVNLHSPVLGAFLQDPRLHALTELLHPYEGRIGTDEKDGMIYNHFINHPDSKFSQMGWHTDNSRDIFLGHRIMPMLNVGIHLDDCPQEKGGLRVLPGTHRASLWNQVFAKKQHIDHSSDPREVALNLHAGDLTVHYGNVWHRVQVSPFYGEASRRRVMYVPVVTGKYVRKHEKSRTPFYYHFAGIVQK